MLVFLHRVIPTYYIAGDLVFLTSFFVLGGDFWDKFSGLFKHGVKITSQPPAVK
jgi:hypothetical protein